MTERVGAEDASPPPTSARSVTIRPVVAADRRSWLTLWEGYNAFYGRSGGTGIGRALIEETAARARAAGCARLYWHTHETNAAAMKLYDQVARKSGFVVYRKDL